MWENLKSQVKKVREDIVESYFLWEVKDNFFCFFRGIRQFFRRIAKIFIYLPIIWKDEDWDYEYVLDLIDFKIARMGKRLAKLGYVEEAKQIEETREYIKDYIDTDDRYLKVEPEPFPIDFDVRNNTFVTLRAETREVLTDEEEEEHRQYITRMYAWQQQQWDKIWDSLKANLSRWWD